tara:strand:- start:1859 stop:2569 length:711 start_codon:yes stop_codon:yes gene_type:complete
MNSILKQIIIITILISYSYTNAQERKKPQNLPRYDFKKIHFGFTLGINELNFNITRSSENINNDSVLTVLPSSQKGFNLGIVSNLRLGKYTDLRFIPTLVFGERHINYEFNNNGIIEEEIKKIESTLIDFPIYLKYKSARYNNFRTYVLCGVKYSLDIASQDQIDDEGEEIVKLKNDDLMGEIGFGIDFYLEYFKFSPQIKISQGILNLISKDNSIYTKSIDQLNTKGWILSFTFE